MQIRNLTVVAFGFMLAVTTLAGGSTASASPLPAPAAFTGTVLTTAAPSVVQSYLPAGSPVTRAAVQAAVAKAEIATRRGTIQALPESTTVDGELALAARAATFGQTYEDGPAVQEMTARTEAAQTAKAQASAKEKSYLDLQSCRQHAQAKLPGGYYRSHWSWCQSYVLHIYTYYNGDLLGTGDFLETEIGRGYSGQRKIELDQWITDITLDGTWQEGGPALQVTLPCRGIPKPEHCQLTGGQWIQLTPGTSHMISFRMTSSDKHATRGNEKVSVGIFTPKFIVQTNTAAGLIVSPPEYGYTQGMRCDSAPYLGANGACIFDRVTGTFTLKRSDRNVSQVATHILTALKNTLTVVPAHGRTIPSSLTRLINTKSIAANRARAVSACGYYFKHRPANTDCDEYPFASTNQGAAKANNHFSVRYISSQQNRTAGSRLGGWYKSDRILDADRFNVHIK